MPFAAITSPRNERIKSAVKLRRRKHRGKQQRTLIDGARELARAMDAGVAIHEIYFCPSLCDSPESLRILEQLEELSMEVFEVTPEVFEKLAFGQRAEGLVAVAVPPDYELHELTLPDNPLIAVMEGIEKPGNLGAAVRSADGAGVSALIAADNQTDLYNPNAIRASLGTVFTTPVCAASTPDVLAWLRENNIRIFAARVDGEFCYTEADFTQPTALVLGTEASGLSAQWQQDDVVGIRLPMLGVADSLNVASSAAVLFYEARRQRDAAESNSSGRPSVSQLA